MNNSFEYSIKTKSNEQFINITNLVEESINKSGIKDGIVVIYCPHTTSGITINENTDPDVKTDILSILDKLIPKNTNYKHKMGNSFAHIKASLIGSDCNIILENGKLKIGKWQSIYLAEFDGPRLRKIYIKIK